jgi:hypothetical protein
MILYVEGNQNRQKISEYLQLRRLRTLSQQLYVKGIPVNN